MDAKGDFLTESICEDAGLLVQNRFGMPTAMYLSTDIHSSFSKNFYAKQRIAPGQTLTAGNSIARFSGAVDYEFEKNQFNRARGAAPSSGKGTKPAAVTVATASEGGSLAATKHYGYKITAVRAGGESPVSVVAAGLTTADNKTITITAPRDENTKDNVVSYYNVYRTAALGAIPVESTKATYKFIGRINSSSSTPSERQLVDAGKVAGGSTAYLLMHDPDALVFKRLGSIIKYDLAVTDTSYKWLQLLYGTIVMPSAQKHCIIENLTANGLGE